jgi:MoxR-like ATPase
MLDAKDVYIKVEAELKKHIAGKADVIKLLFIGLVANGHILLEGVPGVAKTTMSKALADTIQAEFKRIQCMPDLNTEDIIGQAYLDENNEPKLKKGPIFTNILLMDELNRAPPRTMSGFLEALEERQVTVGGVSMALPKPFMAIATQNPLKIEGTEPLPKVLADRFIMRVEVTYPSMQEEETMLELKEKEEIVATNKILSTTDILDLQKQAKLVSLPKESEEYIAQLVDASRKEMHVVMGASPRADVAFMQCGKAKALIEGRKEVTKEDIKFLARAVLSHRIVVRSTGGIGVNGIIDGILSSIQ